MINELSKEERTIFLNLVFFAINCDSLVFNKEKEIFNGYVEQLGIERQIDDFKNESLEETLEQVKSYNKRKKKIIVSEIFGVLISDGIYNEQEKAFITKIGDVLELSREEINIINKAVIEYISSYKKLMNYLQILRRIHYCC